MVLSRWLVGVEEPRLLVYYEVRGALLALRDLLRKAGGLMGEELRAIVEDAIGDLELELADLEAELTHVVTVPTGLGKRVERRAGERPRPSVGVQAGGDGKARGKAIA